MAAAETTGGAASAPSTSPAEIQAGHFPKQIELESGTRLTLQLMTPADAALLHAFFRGIPPDDLLFLRRDVTDRAVIDQWAERIGGNAVITVLAMQDGRIAGEASLHRSQTPWSEHVGEVRVVIDRSLRKSGLGTRLTSEIFLVALQEGIEKIMAEMTIEQKTAMAVFQKLGFRVEGLLRNHVRDRDGTAHDLVLMGHDTREFYDQMRAYGLEEAFGD